MLGCRILCLVLWLVVWIADRCVRCSRWMTVWGWCPGDPWSALGNVSFLWNELSCWGPLGIWWSRLFCDPGPQLIQWTGRCWWQVKGETSVLSCGIVTLTDRLIPSCVVCNPVSMNYISEQYNRYPPFFNCCLKHDMFSMNSHVNGFFWWQIAC